MYQERQPQQQSYSEWDERQQQRFPNSRLGQDEAAYRAYAAQNDQGAWSSAVNVGQGERQLSMAAGVALLLHAVISRSRASLITGPLGAALFWRGQSGYCPVYQAMNINTVQGENPWQNQRNWQGHADVQQIPIQQQGS